MVNTHPSRKARLAKLASLKTETICIECGVPMTLEPSLDSKGDGVYSKGLLCEDCCSVAAIELCGGAMPELVRF